MALLPVAPLEQSQIFARNSASLIPDFTGCRNQGDLSQMIRYYIITSLAN
jgi:hypothetical protein